MNICRPMNVIILCLTVQCLNKVVPELPVWLAAQSLSQITNHAIVYFDFFS